MTYAYLTIDDVPTRNTPRIIDYLCKKNIVPTVFCVGEKLERYSDEALYALKNGAILQNHTYSHPACSNLSFEQIIQEIQKTEDLLDALYAKANILRPYKLFRFPYGDQAGENRALIQNYLRQNGFSTLCDDGISQEHYTTFGCPEDQKQCIDVRWTFDFAEYRMHNEKDFTIQTSLSFVENRFGVPVAPSCNANVCASANASSANDALATEIFLIHDHEESENICAGYFERLVDSALARNVQFVPPRAIKR